MNNAAKQNERNSIDLLNVKPLRGKYTMVVSFSTKPYRLRRMENWLEPNTKYQIVKTLKKDSKRIMWQHRTYSFKLTVIFGSTNMFSELCQMPFILNHMNCSWPRFSLDLSNPIHKAKIGVSAVKIKNYPIILFIFNYFKITDALKLECVTSQDCCKHPVFAMCWVFMSSLRKF